VPDEHRSKRRRTNSHVSSPPVVIDVDRISDPYASHGTSLPPGPASDSSGSRAQPIEIPEDDPEDDSRPNTSGSSVQSARAQELETHIDSQRPAGGKNTPPNLKSLTCVICMDRPTDLTAASCGMFRTFLKDFGKRKSLI
jgi:hypothetical protein